MNKYLKSQRKNGIHRGIKTAIFSLFILSFLMDTGANAQSAGNTAAIPSHLVVKIRLNQDGTRGPVESITPLSHGKAIASDSDASELVAKASMQEQDELELCREKIAAAIANLRRVARNPSREDIDMITLETARKCNIPCAMKQEFGFTRYDSLGRQHDPLDRDLAGREACLDVKPRATGGSGQHGGTWLLERYYPGFTLVGQGQYSNANLPVYGIYTNSYNPYGNVYFPFTNVPWSWYEAEYLYMIYQIFR